MNLIYKDVIVIVGAYSTGKFLTAMFTGNGYACIHVEPCPDLVSDYKVGTEKFESLFIKTIAFNGEIQEVVAALSPYNIKCIIPGSEAGVQLADKLNHALEMTNANTIQHSLARRDKYLMQELLKQHNVPSIPHILSNDLPSILNWIDSSIGYPVVIKPISSSDAEGVYFCSSSKEVKIGFNKIIGKSNVYGEKNTNVLVQQQLYGREYSVNSVSYNGVHFITDIWTNDKKTINGNSVYDCQNLVPKNDPVFTILSGYVKKALDALDIKYGAGHSEVIVTEKGPVLIESGARLAGVFIPSATMEALGYSQLSLLVDIYLNPSRFLELVRLDKEGILNKQIKIVSMIVNEDIEKVLFELDPTDFTSIEGFYCMQYHIKSGQPLQKTIDLTTSPGNFYLISKDSDTLENSYLKIRQAEQFAYLKLGKINVRNKQPIL